MARRTGWLLLALVFLPGCELPEDDWGIVKTIWNDFPWWSIVWRLGLGTLLGAAFGLFVGLAVSVTFRRYRAYCLPWPRVRFWLTTIIFTLNLIAMPILFGAIGFFEGTYRSSAVGLRHSRIGKEWLPAIAAVGADAIAFADVWLDRDAQPDWDEVQRDQRKIDIPRFLARIDQLQVGAGEIIVTKAKQELFDQHPDWQGGTTETVIDWTLPPMISYLLNRNLHGQLAEFGVPDVLTDLHAEATKDGGAEMTHAELTRFLTDRVLISAMLYPLRKWLTGLQTTAFVIAMVWLLAPLAPICATRWINFWWKRRQARQSCIDRL